MIDELIFRTISVETRFIASNAKLGTMQIEFSVGDYWLRMKLGMVRAENIPPMPSIIFMYLIGNEGGYGF